MARVLSVKNLSVTRLIRKFIRLFVEDDLLIAIPARVTGVSDYETYQTVDVKPIFDYIYPSMNNLELTTPTLSKVFVKLPNFGGFSIKFPVTKGDLVTLHWSHKDLNEWLDSTGDDDISQNKNLVGNLEDCWVSPGFGTRKSHQNPSSSNFIIEGAKTTITITPAGKLTIVTSGDTTLSCADYTVNADSIAFVSSSLTHNGTNVGDTHTHAQGVDSDNNSQQESESPS